MKKTRAVGFAVLGVFLLAAAVSVRPLFADERVADAYQSARQSYWAGEYGEALTGFSLVETIDSRYKPVQVRLYRSLSAYRMRSQRSPGRFERYPRVSLRDRPAREVLLSDEREWLYLVSEAENAVHEAATYLSQVLRAEKVSEERLINSRHFIQQGRQAIEAEMYYDAVRYGQAAWEAVDEMLHRDPAGARSILGQVGDTPVTFNVSDLDLRDALKLIYDLTGANIVLSSGISGQVTMNVRDLALRQVLDLIVEMHGLRYLEREGVIVIMTPDEFSRTAEGLRIGRRRVFPLTYADARSVAEQVRDILRIEQVTADTRSNSIIATVANISEAEDLESLIRGLDSPVDQVLLECEMVEVIFDDAKDMGINFLLRDRLVGNVITYGPTFGQVPTFTPGDRLPIDSEAIFFGIAHRDFRAIFNALASEGRARVRHSPRIMSVSGSTATISALDQYPVLTYRTETRTVLIGEDYIEQVYPVPEFDMREIGTIFEVTPIIQEDRTVALNMELIVEQVREELETPIFVGEFQVTAKEPLTSTRQVTQNVVLWDGETLVVGGIRDGRKTHQESRVPGLGKIPILGNLFKRTSMRDRDAELILFLTPRIVRTSRIGREIAEEYGARHERSVPDFLVERSWF